MVMAHPNVRWPDPNQAWEMPQTGHIDGYDGRWLPLMLVATAYLSVATKILRSVMNEENYRMFMDRISQDHVLPFKKTN